MFKDLCSKQHSIKVYTTPGRGKWIRGEDEEFGIVITGNGRPQFKARCRACGTTSSALPYGLIISWGLKITDFVWTKINNPTEYEPCSVRGCQAKPTEHHHFAPYNTFGREADDWPVMPLCQSHHTEWHQRMNGYQWNRKGAV